MNSASGHSTPLGGSVDDAVFRALADRTRRVTLYYLSERGPASVDELADHVARSLGDAVTDAGWHGAARGDAAAGARVALRHVHLPKLADAELICRPGGDAVGLADLDDPVESLLDRAREVDPLADSS